MQFLFEFVKRTGGVDTEQRRRVGGRTVLSGLRVEVGREVTNLRVIIFSFLIGQRIDLTC